MDIKLHEYYEMRSDLYLCKIMVDGTYKTKLTRKTIVKYNDDLKFLMNIYHTHSYLPTILHKSIADYIQMKSLKLKNKRNI